MSKIIRFKPNFALIVLFLIALFSPTSVSPITSSTILLVLLINSNEVKNYKFLFVASILFMTTVSAVQILISGELGKVIVDIYRWIFIAGFILAIGNNNHLSVILAFYVFFVLTFIFSILQQIIPQNTYINNISSIYVSDALMQELFFPGFVRSTGFNEGPGHVGLVALMGCIISPVVFSNATKFKLSGVVFSHFMGLSVIIMAAAKGALVAYFFYVLFFARLKYIIAAIIATVISFFVLDRYFNEEMAMLLRLLQFESGSERLIIWQSLVNLADLNLLQIMFGHGRVGNLSSVSIFDSDWVFIYLTQGLFGIFVVGSLVLRISISSQRKFFLTVGFFMALIVAGLTNPFLTDIKFGPFYWAILISLIIIKRNENFSRHN